MLSRVYEMRRATFHLEDAVKNADYKNFSKSYEQMEKLMKELKDAFYTENAHIIKRTTELDISSMKYKEINELKFLFKPTHAGNIYEGNYIEAFCDERTEQLQTAKAFDAHNEFWMQNVTVHGNIFGSVPAELVSPDSEECLLKYGWLSVDVRILDFGKIQDKQMIVDYCDKYFNYYIIIIEKTTGMYLVLRYDVVKK